MFLVGVGYVIAYNSAMSGGNPAITGHSSDEIMVKNSSGSLVSLQTLIDQGGLGGGNSAFGDWQDITAAASGGAVQGPVANDGLVIARGAWDDSSIIGYTENSSSLVTPKLQYHVHMGGSFGTVSLTMPVKKGDYWKVISAQQIWWVPLN